MRLSHPTVHVETFIFFNLIMLIASSKLLNRTHRLWIISRNVNHLEKRSDDVKERLIKLSSTAVGRYNEIIGFDEIDRAYTKVTQLQEELAKTQGERTSLQLHINHIQQDLANLHSQLQDCKRGEAKFLELMKREFEVIQEKNRLEEKFDIIDNKERELFGHLQAKINILHDKSRTHTRQWGIISTIVGALLGIVGTSISAYFRSKDIRRVQQDFELQIAQITKDVQKVINGYSDMMTFLQQHQQHSQDEGKRKDSSKEAKKEENRESWMGYFGRKTVSVWRWCTFQKAS